VAELAIRLRGVVKRYGPITAVNHLGLDVPMGTCVGLLGPNGAGKSTTMRLLTAQAIADEGELEVLGFRLPGESKAAGRSAGSRRSSTTRRDADRRAESPRLHAPLPHPPLRAARGDRPGAEDGQPRRPAGLAPVDTEELVTAEALWIATRAAVYGCVPLLVAMAFGLDPAWGC